MSGKILKIEILGPKHGKVCHFSHFFELFFYNFLNNGRINLKMVSFDASHRSANFAYLESIF